MVATPWLFSSSSKTPNEEAMGWEINPVTSNPAFLKHFSMVLNVFLFAFNIKASTSSFVPIIPIGSFIPFWSSTIK